MSGAVLGAGLLVAAAIWLSSPVRGSAWGIVLLAAGTGSWWAGGRGVLRDGVALLVVALVVFAVALLWHRRRRRQRAALERSGRVREVCELLAADLGAGLPVQAALAGAAKAWPEWETVSRSAELGGSASQAMLRLAARAGAGDLRQVAGAWLLSQRSGAALAAALREVSLALADQEQTRRVVRSELASARATARLVVALPVATLAMGSGMGDPVGFLIGSPAGWACLAGGVALALIGLAWLERIAAQVEGEAW
ncbi:type II secretion system F family protein [Nocardioides dubius]|uniref:Type II secretion system protein GspF domain-containing protein n=1 Tax=Nocardioides dubius TaxID=317019 RepID=A0ABP4EL94_9ACTN